MLIDTKNQSYYSFSRNIVVNPAVIFISLAKLFHDQILQSLFDYTLRDIQIGQKTVTLYPLK